MARLRLLHLPLPSMENCRFAVVVDRCDPPLPDNDIRALRDFADQAGAQGCLVVSASLDFAEVNDDGPVQVVQADGDILAKLLQGASGKPTQERDRLARWGAQPQSEGPQSA